jgi:hypothetical protein
MFKLVREKVWNVKLAEVLAPMFPEAPPVPKEKLLVWIVIPFCTVDAAAVHMKLNVTMYSVLALNVIYDELYDHDPNELSMTRPESVDADDPVGIVFTVL